jgi:anti-sigma factor RsiW
LGKSDPPKETRHPDELLLPYVEGLLNPEERASLEKHIAECAECSASAQALNETVEGLRTNRDAFCPDPWELHEFAFYSIDAAGIISEHIQDCPVCNELVKAWKSEASKEQLPRELWGRLKQALPKKHGEPIWKQDKPAGFMERLRAMFDVPTWAIGAATVVVLLAIMLYPREVPQSVIALSSVSWENVPKPKTFQAVPKRTAIIILLKDFHPAVDQPGIDALYEAVAPSMDIYERYYVVPPILIRDLVRKGLVDPSNRTKMLRELKDRLDLTSVVNVTAVSGTEGIAFEAELVDVSTGAILGKKTDSKLTRNDLGPQIRRAALQLLLEH